MASTYDRLKKIVIEQLGVDEGEVNPEASFVDDLNADSLDLVELIMSLEEEFGTEISDEDAEKIRTVRTPSSTSTSIPPNSGDTEGAMRPADVFADHLGLPIQDRDLLEQALIHSSWLHEHRDLARGHNERLEFLGDAVVNLAISESLYARHPHDDEGVLSARRAAIVSTPGLTRLAFRMTWAPTSCSGRARRCAADAAGRPCSHRRSRRWPERSISISAGRPLGIGSIGLAEPELQPISPVTTLKSPKSRLQEHTQRTTGDRPDLPAPGRSRGPITRNTSGSTSRWMAESSAAARGILVASTRRDSGRGRGAHPDLAASGRRLARLGRRPARIAGRQPRGHAARRR